MVILWQFDLKRKWEWNLIAVDRNSVDFCYTQVNFNTNGMNFILEIVGILNIYWAELE